jgi:sugar phosphate isomerase/epimerase
MEISICSFSFHRTLAAGKQDIFQYIADCQALGATHLEPWIAHLGTGRKATPVLGESNGSQEVLWSKLRALMQQPPPVLWPGDDPKAVEDGDYLDRVKAAAEKAHMPFSGIAVDGAHIYEPSEAARQANRARAYQWLDVAEKLGAKQMRVDAATRPVELTGENFQIIVEGYQDLVARGRPKGVEILIENHVGPSKFPDEVIKILEAVDGLGFLLDTNNWAEGLREEGWYKCAKYARATHIKTFEFDAAGNDPTVDLEKAINILIDAGYQGCWGIESSPTDGNEYEAVQKTIALIHRVVG